MFKIENAEISCANVLIDGSNSFELKLTLIEKSYFAPKLEVVWLYLPIELLRGWQEVCATGNYPSVNAKYITVENLPSYSFGIEDNGSIVVMNSAKVLVLLDSDGNPRQDPRRLALKKIEAYHRVVR